MRALVQRVTEASVDVVGDPATGESQASASVERVAAIGPGLLVLLGVTHDDTPAMAGRMADKLLNLRVFDDEQGVMNRSCAEVGGALLVVSQFTLYGDTRKGRRPSYVQAARPEHAAPIVEAVVEALRARGAEVATGQFRAQMNVSLVNHGPVTLLLQV